MKRIDGNRFKEQAPEIVTREEILQLAKSQKAKLATRFEDLLGDGGPVEETADEIICAIREWRGTDSKRS